MNDTEQLFLMAAVWTIIAVVLARFIPNWPGRIAFVAVAVGLPFWELPYGFYHFRKLCSEQLAFEVFEKIVPQDSVCLEYFDFGQYNQLVRAGFSRIEITGRSDNAKEYAASGRVQMTNRDQAKSPYCITFRNNIRLPWSVSRADILVERVRENLVAGRQSSFTWTGMWWQAQASPVLGRGGVCSGMSNEAIVALRRGAG